MKCLTPIQLICNLKAPTLQCWLQSLTSCELAYLHSVECGCAGLYQLRICFWRWCSLGSMWVSWEEKHLAVRAQGWEQFLGLLYVFVTGSPYNVTLESHRFSRPDLEYGWLWLETQILKSWCGCKRGPHLAAVSNEGWKMRPSPPFFGLWKQYPLASFLLCAHLR